MEHASEPRSSETVPDKKSDCDTGRLKSLIKILSQYRSEFKLEEYDCRGLFSTAHDLIELYPDSFAEIYFARNTRPEISTSEFQSLQRSALMHLYLAANAAEHQLCGAARLYGLNPVPIQRSFAILFDLFHWDNVPSLSFEFFPYRVGQWPECLAKSEGMFEHDLKVIAESKLILGTIREKLEEGAAKANCFGHAYGGSDELAHQNGKLAHRSLFPNGEIVDAELQKFALALMKNEPLRRGVQRRIAKEMTGSTKDARRLESRLRKAQCVDPPKIRRFEREAHPKAN